MDQDLGSRPRGQSTTPDDYGNTYENASKEPWVATGQHWLYRIVAVSGGGATAAIAGTVLVGMSGLTGAAGLTGGQIATGFLATAGLGLGVDEVQHGLTGYPSALDSVLSEVTTPGKAAAIKIGLAIATGDAESIGQALDDFPKALKSLFDAIKGAKGTVSCIDDAARTPALKSRGYDRLEIETKAPNAIKAKDVVDDWEEFLGRNPTNIDPRDGLPDPDRLWSQDGNRSIRYGQHEMQSKPNKSHYHRETWYDDHVDNVLQRIFH